MRGSCASYPFRWFHGEADVRQSARMDTSLRDSRRLKGLLDAVLAINSEHSLDDLLQQLVEVASSLTGARYGALGVLDEPRVALERFVTTGLDEEARAGIGDLPIGRGILGALIEDAVPLRLADLGSDPRSVGFPPGHPPMRSFLGAPIRVRGVVYGNLYLTEKESGEEFSNDDEELVTLLAAQAGVAIENARLFTASEAWIRQLEFLGEVGNALIGDLELDSMLHLIVTRLRDVLDARLAVIMLPGPDGLLHVEAADGEGAEAARGMSSAPESSKAGAVMARRQGERIDSVADDPELDQSNMRRLGSSSAMFVPMIVRDRAIGVVAVHDKLTRDRRFSEGDLRLTEMFADRAAVAIDLSRRIERESLGTFMRAQELERGRFARELHDETGQAFTAILLGLRSVETATTPEELGAAVESLRALTVSALDDVRRLAFELRPKALDDFGLPAALEHLVHNVADRSGIVVDLEGVPSSRFDPEIETAVYRTVQESLTNVVKHAMARHVSIVVSRRPTALAILVEDDGNGFEPAAVEGDHFGLEAMRERLALVGGSLRVESSHGHGTTLHAIIPLQG